MVGPEYPGEGAVIILTAGSIFTIQTLTGIEQTKEPLDQAHHDETFSDKTS